MSDRTARQPASVYAIKGCGDTRLPTSYGIGLPTDHVTLDEYMGVWFHSKVSEAVEVGSMGISFRTELQEKITSRHHVIEYLKKVGATSGWLMHLNKDQEDDVLLLGFIDIFVHMMYEIVRKRKKDVRELDY
ncbi:hypothetical protein Tco_0863775 [Tanacetum coccineum]